MAKKINNSSKIVLLTTLSVLLFVLIASVELSTYRRLNQYLKELELYHREEVKITNNKNSFITLRNKVEGQEELAEGGKWKNYAENSYEILYGLIHNQNSFDFKNTDIEKAEVLYNQLEVYYAKFTDISSTLQTESNISDLPIVEDWIGIITTLEELSSLFIGEVKILIESVENFYDAVEKNIILTIVLPSILLLSFSGYLIYSTASVDKKVYKLAYYDSVSGLPNRSYFLEKAAIKIKALSENLLKGLILIDAHTITKIDGTLGPAVGDEVLKQLGFRLSTHFKENFAVGRLGGCVFMLLTPKVKNVGEIKKIAARTIEIFEEPFVAKGHTLNVDVNLGISIIGSKKKNVEEFEKHAGNALALSLKQGYNTYKIFDEHMEKSLICEMELEAHIKAAIENKEFKLHFQPINCASNEQISGVEALIRWENSQGKMVSPADFLPVAERTGMIIPIGRLVLEKACVQLKDWNLQGLNLTMCINVSPIELSEKNFVSNLKRIITDTGIKPSSLILEITEHSLVEDFEIINTTIKEVRKLGVRIALDDFGTGYSSLGYLMKLEIDVLKIDKLFVDPLTSNEDQLTIIDDIVSIAHKLGFKVIAEGVETKEQAEILKQKDVDFLQGYYYSKPLDAKDLKLN